jgi:type IV secretory pathway protease TraF
MRMSPATGYLRDAQALIKKLRRTHGKREAVSAADAHIAINGNLRLAIETFQPGLVPAYARID